MNDDLIPEGPPLGLTPILAVSDAHAAIAFYAQAFGATEIARIAAPGTSRLMHVRMNVFGTVFVFMDEIPELAAEESGVTQPAPVARNIRNTASSGRGCASALAPGARCGSSSRHSIGEAILGRTLRAVERPVRARMDNRPDA
jgi:hypothetical protein